ncbi:hypothetical protein [Pelomonas cellulosilytica]|uniref:Uncharacterized protein n=1 Tax=Pelomonas cellulosilytica TaxID=2906762 RepID=A0ABS8XT50_9BURK|nr:hypothetical protein [Pelomonas sp. P8]MCE4555896.1 hypothetical protein [Pelomonas sp. P8]
MDWKTSLWGLAACLELSGTARPALVLQPDGQQVLDTEARLLWFHDWNRLTFTTFPVATGWVSGLAVGGARAGDWGGY